MSAVYASLYGITILSCLSGVHSQNIRQLGEFYMKDPGFTEVFTHADPGNDDTEVYSFMVSCFNPIPGTKDPVYFVRYPGKYLDDPSATEYEPISEEYSWPREPNHPPEEVFGFNQVAAVADGFLTTGKNNGTVWLSDLRDENNIINTDIVRTPDDEYIWFYNSVNWLDADGDGLQDVFACRTRSEGFPAAFYSEFIWLKNPGGEDAVTTPTWQQTLISSNDCDTFMQITTLEVDGESFSVIFTVGYFVNAFSVYWSNDPSGRWDDPDMIESRLISQVTDDADCTPGEEYCGHFFDLVLDDLNGDGKLDILMSINSEVYGYLVGIEIPDDFRYGEYIFHDIAEGFFPTSGLNGGGSPGQPQTFFPQEFTAGKPWLLVSGDDDGCSYYFIPNSQSATDWSYTQIKFVDRGEGNIVGKPVAFDSNGDGFTDVFVPAWSADEMMVYTFAP